MSPPDVVGRPLKVVHLPCYDDNAYQPHLLTALKRTGVVALDGGGGGRFFRTALFSWRADILHFHWLHPYTIRASWLGSLIQCLRFLLATTFLRLFGQRIVWTVHNLQSHDRKHSRLERHVSRRFSRLADRLIVHCSAAKTEADAYFGVKNPGKTVVIPHGNYIGCYPNGMSCLEARKRLGIAPSKLVFLFFGRIEPYKGVLELIETFRGLQESDTILLIAGRTPNIAVNRLIEDAGRGDARIMFRPGYVPDEDVHLFMNAADVVVFPYRDVLTSGAMILAMSFAKACIAPRRGCIPETLTEQGGFLFRGDDRVGLREALAKACAARADLTAMGAANLRRTNEWSWDFIAGRTFDLYREVVGRCDRIVSR